AVVQHKRRRNARTDARAHGCSGLRHERRRRRGAYRTRRWIARDQRVRAMLRGFSRFAVLAGMRPRSSQRGDSERGEQHLSRAAIGHVLIPVLQTRTPTTPYTAAAGGRRCKRSATAIHRFAIAPRHWREAEEEEDLADVLPDRSFCESRGARRSARERGFTQSETDVLFAAEASSGDSAAREECARVFGFASGAGA